MSLVALQLAEIDICKSKIATTGKTAKQNLLSLISKKVPVIDLGIIILSFKFQPYGYSNSWDIAF